MSARGWGRANAAKVAVGIVLAVIVAPVVDVISRHWPTGGAR